MHTAMLLEMVADGDPDRIVVGRRDAGITAGQLLERARRSAAFFEQSGADYVGYFGLNADVLPMVIFGASIAGLPFAPLNYRSTDTQLGALLPRIAPALVVAAEREWDRLHGCGAENLLTDTQLLQAATEAGGSSADTVMGDEEGVAVLLFTSGTTGDPKAALLRNRHLVSYIFSTVDFLSSDASEAQLISVPPYHIAGVSAVLSSIYSGRRIVYLPAFDPEAWIDTVLDEEISHAMVVPTMLSRIIEVLSARGQDLPSLRHLSYGGGRMPAGLVMRMMELLPTVNLVNAYGLTETSSTVAMLTPDDHREAFASDDPAVRGRLSSVGRPLPTLEVVIRDPDGAPVADGTSGEIWVRGDQVAGEYAGVGTTASDGWFRTKDAGSFDADGFLYVEGRLDDVIVRGGENISPGEVEDVLIGHAAVRDVAVIGVPDAEWGEAIAAVVVLHPDATVDEATLQEWVRHALRSSKTPSLVVFRDELPYNSTGKLLRRELRSELAEAQST